MYENKVTHMLVTNAALDVAAGSVTTYADLVDNTIAFVLPSGVKITASLATLADAYGFKAVQRSGTRLLYSPVIYPNKVTAASRKTYTAPAQQVSYIGYGSDTSQEIDVLGANLYEVSIDIQTEDIAFNQHSMYKFGIFDGVTASTQKEICEGLYYSLLSNFKREVYPIINFARVCNLPIVNTNNFTGAVTVTKDSEVVTLASLAYGAGNVEVGDYIRISRVSAVTAIVLTDDLYKVEELYGTTGLRLDRPYLGATWTGTGVNQGTEVITAANIIGVIKWGIKCTGVSRETQCTPAKNKWWVYKFKINLKDCGTTAVTYTTAGNNGNGSEWQTRDMEWFYQGNNGQVMRAGLIPPIAPRDSVVATYQYGYISIEFYSEDISILQTNRSKETLIIAGRVAAGDAICAMLTTSTIAPLADFPATWA